MALYCCRYRESAKMAIKIRNCTNVILIRKYTEELRLYGFGGNDKFIVNGTNDKIKIRMIGGKGVDNFENKAKSGEGVIVYDSLRENNQVTGEFKNKMSNKTIANSYDLLYYKYNQVIPFISVGYNLDDGVYLRRIYEDHSASAFVKLPTKTVIPLQSIVPLLRKHLIFDTMQSLSGP